MDFQISQEQTIIQGIALLGEGGLDFLAITKLKKAKLSR